MVYSKGYQHGYIIGYLIAYPAVTQGECLGNQSSATDSDFDDVIFEKADTRGPALVPERLKAHVLLEIHRPTASRSWRALLLCLASHGLASSEPGAARAVLRLPLSHSQSDAEVAGMLHGKAGPLRPPGLELGCIKRPLILHGPGVHVVQHLVCHQGLFDRGYELYHDQAV